MSSPIRVFVVDDYDQFRRFICSTLERKQGLQVVGEATDGLEAVRIAEKLQPDMILLDIGLPDAKRTGSCESYPPSRFRRKNHLLDQQQGQRRRTGRLKHRGARLRSQVRCRKRTPTGSGRGPSRRKFC